MRLLAILVCAALALPLQPTSAAGQEPGFVVCQSRDDLERRLAVPDATGVAGCRRIVVTVAPGTEERICRLDLTGGDRGLLDQLRNAALPDTLWTPCRNLPTQAVAR
jgi:hypothetical protein